MHNVGCLICIFVASFLRWLWAEAGAQSDLENSLGIGGFGYPAMAAVNARKMKFALLKGSFSEQGINEFLRYKICCMFGLSTLPGSLERNVWVTKIFCLCKKKTVLYLNVIFVVALFSNYDQTLVL